MCDQEIMHNLCLKGGMGMLKTKQEQLWKTQDELTEVMGLIIKLDQLKNEVEEKDLVELGRRKSSLWRLRSGFNEK